MRAHSENWTEILRDLEHFFQNSGDFFHGGRVILELLNEQALDKPTFVRLRKILEDRDLQLWAVTGGNPATQHLIREQGIRTRLPQDVAKPKPKSSSQSNGIFVEKTIRSGQRLESVGHVTVLGDVNPGGEVVAAGTVVVWGHVRGVVHAGALGDRQAVICALALEPAQLRIAELITRAPEGGQLRPGQPEIARIQDNVIIVEPWTVRGG
jgi:septum site-determining protein MinC